MAAKHKSQPPKVTALLAEGTFNPAAEQVRDPKFRRGRLLRSARPRAGQVRAAAPRLPRARVGDRRHRRSMACRDRRTIRPRPTSPQAGIAGLVPRKRGPRGPHKLQGEALGVRRTASRRGRARARADAREAATTAVRPRPSTPGRSSERSPEKKLRDDECPEQFCRAISSSSRTTKRCAAPPSVMRCRPRRVLG